MPATTCAGEASWDEPFRYSDATPEAPWGYIAFSSPAQTVDGSSEQITDDASEYGDSFETWSPALAALQSPGHGRARGGSVVLEQRKKALRAQMENKPLPGISREPSTKPSVQPFCRPFAAPLPPPREPLPALPPCAAASRSLRARRMSVNDRKRRTVSIGRFELSIYATTDTESAGMQRMPASRTYSRICGDAFGLLDSAKALEKPVSSSPTRSLRSPLRPSFGGSLRAAPSSPSLSLAPSSMPDSPAPLAAFSLTAKLRPASIFIQNTLRHQQSESALAALARGSQGLDCPGSPASSNAESLASPKSIALSARSTIRAPKPSFLSTPSSPLSRCFNRAPNGSISSTKSVPAFDQQYYVGGTSTGSEGGKPRIPGPPRSSPARPGTPPGMAQTHEIMMQTPPRTFPHQTASSLRCPSPAADSTSTMSHFSTDSVFEEGPPVPSKRGDNRSISNKANKKSGVKGFLRSVRSIAQIRVE